MWGNLGAFLERLDDEWNGSLKVGGVGVRQVLVGLSAVGLCTNSAYQGRRCAA